MNKDNFEINFIGLTHDHMSVQDGQVEQVAANGENIVDTSNGQAAAEATEELCSAISILKRHPMYDCLVLVKKYRNCLNGYALEFPIDRIRENERIPTNESAKHTSAGNYDDDDENKQQDATNELKTTETSTATTVDKTCNMSACSQRRLVSRFLDGDDPMYSPALLYTLSGHSISLMQDNNDDSNDLLSRSHQNQRQQQQVGDGAGNVDDSAITSENDPVTVECVQVPFMRQIDDKGELCHLVHVPVNGLLDRLELYTRNGIAIDSRVYAFAMGLKTAERMMTTKSMKELQETPI